MTRASFYPNILLKLVEFVPIPVTRELSTPEACSLAREFALARRGRTSGGFFVH